MIKPGEHSAPVIFFVRDKMKTIESTTVLQDIYPAGLHLAGTLWATFAKNRGAGVSIRSIRECWDGVKLEGHFRNRRFWVEINYANEAIVLLAISTKKTLLETQASWDKFESELKKIFETTLETIEGRKVIRVPQQTASV